MSQNKTNEVNDTICKMVNYMTASVNTLVDVSKEPAKNDTIPIIDKTPLKRPASNMMNDDEVMTPKKFRGDLKMDFEYLGSPREMRRLRSDVLEARNTILNLENRISQMHNLRKEMQVIFDNENQTLKKQQEVDRKTIMELENKLQQVRRREQELKQEFINMKSKHDNLKIQTDQKLEEMEKKICNMTSEFKAQEGEENSEIASLKRQILELQDHLQTAEEDADVHKKLYKELEKELVGKSSAVGELEQKNAEIQKLQLQLKEYEYVKENYLEYQEQAKTQARKLSQYIDMEKENQKLREENQRIKDEIRNKLILEEEVHDLKSRLVKFKEQESKFASVQMQLVQADMYLNEWKAVARGILEESEANDTALPHLLRSAVERLQQQELNLTDEKVNLQSQLNTALHEAKVAKEELAKNQKLLTKLSGTDEQKKNLIHRMQKKLLLVSRERDSYRLQLDSYERDLTMTVNTTALGSQAANQVQGLKERVQELEKIVSEYRDLVAKLENDIQYAESEFGSDLPPVKLEQISRLQNDLERLKQENTRLRERKDQLEIQLEEYIVGNDTLRGGNVYHLANNPLTECINQREVLIDKLQDEVDRLKRKVKNMEEGMESSRLADISMSTREVQLLKEEIKSKEAQHNQMKDYFKSSIQEFRDVVYMLLGYKIDRNSKALYKLTNMYSECEDDILCFQLKKDGLLQLLETPFSSSLESMIDLHLRQQNSLPNFLSTLTLNLYSTRTMVTEQIE
ncbi:mitotic spindle assembly checkpoint protein MAD1 [Coccinella septempunctata]|uniref:mitotic spindle assembly checkpoint protein MAD1 n=1 Tax=Coccinella septempunctata TaxID=41139 RepID=UPI001D08C0CD|nr:mitotic spindle assembly checkpoint protein MAD1 [Coccinella septempunctata]